MTRKGILALGAISGVKAWLAYWIVECFLTTVLPWLLTPSYDYRSTHPLYPAFALVVYVIAGTVLSAAGIWIIEAILPGRAQRAAPVMGSLTLASAFTIHALSNWQHVQMLMAIVIMAAGLVVIGTDRPMWARRLAPVTTFWCVPLILLAYPFTLTQYFYKPMHAHLVSAAAVVLAFSLPYVAERVRKAWAEWRPFEASAGPPPRPVWLGLVPILLASTFVLKQQPIRATTAAPISRGPAGPNVILISLDTVRADHLSVYGYSRDTSPNLRALAREATVFTKAVAASDITLTSHASMFTGLYGSQHGAYRVLQPQENHGVQWGAAVGMPLPANSKTLAKILAGHGYQTIGVVANTTFLNHAFRLNQGFEYYSQPYPALFLNVIPDEVFYLRRSLMRFLTSETTSVYFQRAADINREALQILQRQRPEGRPFFLFLNYMDAHEPYCPPSPYDTKYGVQERITFGQYARTEELVLSGARSYTDHDRERDQSLYDGGIAYMDESIGELFQKLKEMGLYENSLIIVTSDHGQSFGEKQLVGHGNSVYHEQVHVPLIIKYPGVTHGEVRDDLASHVDLLPTILDTLGFELPPSLPGRNLRTPANAAVTVMSESFPNDRLVSLHPRFRRIERAVYTGSFKFIAATDGTRELYDLSKDPREEHNLYSPRMAIASRLEAGLTHGIGRVGSNNPALSQANMQAIRSLKSLGYLQ